MMRKLIVFGAVTALLAASPAMACRSAYSETHVFLPTLPKELDPGMVILRVAPPVEQMDENYVARVRVIEAVQGDWNGETAMIDYGPFTSCSRADLPTTGAYVVGQRSILPSRLVVRQYRRGELVNEGRRDQ